MDGRSLPRAVSTGRSSAATSWPRRASIRPRCTTFDARREAALAISDPDSEFWGWGVTPNQSGDGYGFLILLIQAFGGSFTDETGMKVHFNSPETVAAFEWLAETYDRNGKYAAMLPPGIESWGDISNNEAYLAGKIGYTPQRLRRSTRRRSATRIRSSRTPSC